jgi:hypothetical protein
VQFFFLPYFKKNYPVSKLLDQLKISRISGRAIWYPAGYRISKKAGLSGRISGASLLINKPETFGLQYPSNTIMMEVNLPRFLQSTGTFQHLSNHKKNIKLSIRCLGVHFIRKCHWESALTSPYKNILNRKYPDLICSVLPCVWWSWCGGDWKEFRTPSAATLYTN